MKKLYTIIICALLLALLCVPALANTADSMMRDARDAVSTAVDEGKDLVTDLKDMVDPDGDGEPEAEGDGVVDDDDKTTSKDTTNERPQTENSRDTTDRTTDRETTDRDTTDRETTDRADETTGVIEGMELEEKGINPWAIVIAVIIVIAVLVLIFILIPKRR